MSKPAVETFKTRKDFVRFAERHSMNLPKGVYRGEATIGDKVKDVESTDEKQVWKDSQENPNLFIKSFEPSPEPQFKQQEQQKPQ